MADRELTTADDDLPLRRLGRYELIARIGEGGMAEVHLARMRGPMGFQKVVVLKTIHPDLGAQDQFLNMLLDEARLSALIKHPRVVDIYELGKEGDTFFIAMEYLDGQPMSRLIAAGMKGFPLDPCSTARLIADAAEGLHAAHELVTMSGRAVELVHRDVSPGNIMVLYDGTVKIVDFGVAKARGRLTNSGARQLKGKLGYMSPEQLAGQAIDRRSDIFSLGVVMWEALTLRRLWPGDALAGLAERMEALPVPPSTFQPQVPPQLDAICLRALASAPADRFQTAGELKDAIEEALRAVGNYRETEMVGQHMTRLFARQRNERSQVLRRRASTSAEVAILDDHSDPGVGVTPAARTHETTAPEVLVSGMPDAASGARWKAIVGILGVLVVAVAVGALLFFKADRSSAPVTTLAMNGPPVALAPETAPEPQPTVEPAAAPPVESAKPVEQLEPVDPASGDDATATDEPRTPRRPAKGTKSVAALYAEGADLFVQGKHALAKDRFKEAIGVDPRHAPSYRGLGLVYQAQGKKERAIRAFEKYLHLAPNAPDAAAIRARIAKLRE